MAYLVHHHGTYWFQIRVPKPLAACYGQLIRQNLQTTDRAIAQALAFQLAGQWLARFTAERMSHGPGICAVDVSAPAQSALHDVHVTHSWVGSQSQSLSSIADGGDHKGSQLVGRAGQTIIDTLDGILKYWRQLNPEVRVSTYREFETCVKEFRRTVHKRPADLQRSDIAMYRDQLIRAGLARATVGKKVGFISTLLQTAYDAGLISQNAARGMRIPKPKVPEVKRRAFIVDELRRIFTSPVYTKTLRPRAAGGEAAAWVPMIALATGARLEEICQLKVSDLYVDERHGPLMRISDGDDGQSVKTLSSRRTLPLHPELIRAGLIDYREAMQDAGQEWLFPDLGPDHDYRRGGNFGKWFARYLRSSSGCGIEDKQVVFHSFRHTFKTLCRDAGIPEEIHDALTGHVGSTVGRSYGHMPLSALTAAVALIRFPVVFPRID